MTAAMTARPDSQPRKGRAAIARRCSFPVLTRSCEVLAGPPWYHECRNRRPGQSDGNDPLPPAPDFLPETRPRSHGDRDCSYAAGPVEGAPHPPEPRADLDVPAVPAPVPCTFLPVVASLPELAPESSLLPVTDALNGPKQARRTASSTDTAVVNDLCHAALASAKPYSPAVWRRRMRACLAGCASRWISCAGCSV